MKEYFAPDFDITIYEFEDVFALSSIFIAGKDPNGDSNEWFG